MNNIKFRNKLRAAIKIVYRDWFDGKAKVHKFYNNKNLNRFIQRNKIEIIGIS